MEDQTKHYLISGRVQGVGFRRFVERQARALGLRGWVRNLTDGRVEAWAEGSMGLLLELEKELRKGPSASRVDSLAISEKSATNCTDFSVKSDGDRPCSDE